MNDRNDDVGRTDGSRTLAEEAGDHAQVLEKTFNLDPETARVSADDKIASGMRKPASDEVELERIAAAKREATP